MPRRIDDEKPDAGQRDDEQRDDVQRDAAALHGLRERLPRYYQENAQILGPLLEASEIVLAAIHDALARVAHDWSADSLVDLRERWRLGDAAGLASAAPNFPGPTPALLRKWFRKHWGFSPRLWTGFAAAVRTPSAGARASLKLRATCWPSVIVLWDRESYGDPSHPFVMTREQLPAGTRLQVVLLSADEGERPAYHGRGLVGELWWDSQAASTDSPTADV